MEYRSYLQPYHHYYVKILLFEGFNLNHCKKYVVELLVHFYSFFYQYEP